MNLVGLLWLNANNKIVLVSSFINYEFFSFEFMKGFGNLSAYIVTLVKFPFLFLTHVSDLLCSSVQG